ncbi:M48 family metalloprotease [Caulobacter sp. NIBR1757]|uniref:M48 family metalloprotease n=1 Tax=Caulobacter sp. NIBR1757 TaxID=3016000 RepID=UPI0022F0C464|nr:M48 family metalloprotease [Caulobacter sp. NIBR1757]WGM37774.1 hypothetical protein AMEJIAPC_00674 [Caulobacter sp. NIBR1757]
MLRSRRLGGALLAGSVGLALAAGAVAGEVNASLKLRCEAAANASASVDKNIFDKALGWVGSGLKGTASTLGDRFSVSGKTGPYACSPETGARVAALRAKQAQAEADAKAAKAGGPVKSKALNLALQADAAGKMRPTLFHMPQTQAKLQQIVNNIARTWPYKDATGGKPPTVLIDANLGYNAEARADNTIVLWLGVLADPTDGVSQQLADGDLYWMLGHEYSHLALGHMESDEMGEFQRRFLHDVTTMMKRGAMLESSINYAETAPGADAPDLKEAYRDAREGQQGLRYLMDSILYPAWGRMQEDEADAAGIDAAYLAGVPPRTAHSVNQFEASEIAIEKRIEAVQTAMTQRADKVMKDPRYQEALRQGDLAGAFDPVLKALEKGFYAGIRKWFTETFSREHRAAANRSDGIGRYKKAAYIQTGLTPANADPVDGLTEELLKLPELRAGIATARQVKAAELALDGFPTDKGAAAKAIGQALKGPFANEAYVRFTAHRVSKAHLRYGEAIAHLEVAVRSKYPSPESFRELIRLYARNNQIDKARQMLAKGRATFPDSDYFLPSDIRIQVRTRQFDAAHKTLDLCRATRREQIMLNCMEATMEDDYKNLSEKDKKRLAELALWGEDPKAGDKGKGPSIQDSIKKIPMPWNKKGR